MAVEISYAPAARKLLNGILCVYKPAFVSMKELRRILTANLAKDLCDMECREPETHVSITGDTSRCLTVEVGPSYADHPLMVGPRYLNTDIRCHWVKELGTRVSGVCLLGLNRGIKDVGQLSSTHPLRTYHITAKLGERTSTFFSDGEVKYRGRYEYIKPEPLEQILAMVQAAHQKKMFEFCGVDMSSQEGYELAASGPLRVTNYKLPVLYSIKCVNFNLPYITLEVTCVNEDEDYLIGLTVEIAERMRTAATCTSLHIIRFSAFTIEDALLRKHWTLENILSNINRCKQIIKENKLKQVPVNLRHVNAN